MNDVDLRKDSAEERSTEAARPPERTGRRKMGRFQKLIVWLVVLVFVYFFYVTLDANKYQATVLPVEGEGRVGVNPTTELLDFGDLSPGTSATRVVTIENGTAIPMFVFSLRFGGVGELMDPDKNFFVIPARGAAQVAFEVYMPASARVGERLNGRVYLFKLPGPWPSN